MFKLRRLLTIGILTFVLVSACRGNAPQQSISQADNTSAETVRVVNHAMGKSKVPVNPQRVVVLSAGLDTVLSLGVKPVGSVEVGRGLDYLKDRLEGIENAGSSNSPNLEAIVALKPDLILGSMFDQKSYKLLSQIAPTVFAEIKGSGDWKKLLNKYAEALGKTDKAEQIMADYQARIEEFQAQMGNLLQKTEVSILNVSHNEMQIYLEDSFPGTIVADAGLPRPPDQTNTEQTFNVDISKELFHKADGDVIFVWSANRNEEIAREAQTEWEQSKANPLWSKLNAVQQGKVYDVPGYWIGMGPISANLVLDDLFEHLIEDNL